MAQENYELPPCGWFGTLGATVGLGYNASLTDRPMLALSLNDPKRYDSKPLPAAEIQVEARCTTT